jgi:hypothetical protein
MALQFGIRAAYQVGNRKRTQVQSELFERPRLSGLVQADAIVTPDEEQVLMASIDAVGLSPFRFHGWLGKRLTASFGWNYDFDTARFAPTEPIPAWLLPLCGKAARFAAKLQRISFRRYSSATTWEPGSAGTVIAGYSDTWLESRLGRLRRCGFAGVGPAAGLTAPRPSCRHARSIT